MRLGNTIINALKLGSTAIGLVYLGTTGVFGVPVVTYLGNATNAVSNTVQTFASSTFGTAHLTRQIVVFVASYTGSAAAPTGVTVGGTAASSRVSSIAGDGAVSTSMWNATVPTGASGDIVATFAVATAFCQIGWFSVTNANTTPSSTASDNTFTGAALNFSITCPTRGCIVCNMATDSLTPPTIAWTNATESWESTGARADYVGGGAIGTTAGSTSVTATLTGSLSPFGAMLGVAFSPLGG